MLRKLLLFFMLICVTKCKHSLSHSMEDLYTVLDQTTEYFKNLSNAYKVSSDTDILQDVDNVIATYMENTTETILNRKKRSARVGERFSNDVKMLQGFEENIFIDIPISKDVAFFSMRNKHQLFQLIATINSTDIQLYQLIGNRTLLLGMYSQSNGKRLIVNTYGNDTLVVVQKNNNKIVVLRLSQDENGFFKFQFKQEFLIYELIDMNMWSGMNQQYLGVATNTQVFIYVWFGEYFDKIDTLQHGARKLLTFQSKSFTHIVALGSPTKIFKFSVRSNKFIEMQKLQFAEDISSFHFKKNHFEEHILALAGVNSIILYKEMYDRFVPFQKLAATKYLHSVNVENTTMLFVKEKNTVEIYQYNGWRFVKLHVKLFDIYQIRQIRSYDEDTLVVQNDEENWRILKPLWTLKKTWQYLQNDVDAWCHKTIQKVSHKQLKRISDFNDPVKISNAHIGQLRALKVNGNNASELIDLTEQYKKLITKLNLANDNLKQIMDIRKSNYTILHGKRIVVKCKTKCFVRRINTETKIKPITKSDIMDFNDTNVEFNRVKVSTINNWKCPSPNFNGVVNDIVVLDSINGFSMQYLQEETLRVTGNQVVSGEHEFYNLYAKNISIPLDIASEYCRVLRATSVTVKDLHLSDDTDYFLSTNASKVTIPTTIRAKRVKLTGVVNLNGGIGGKSLEKFAPLKDMPQPLVLHNDCFLQNVTFRNLINVTNIIGANGESLKDILNNSISVNSNVSVHVILSSNKTQWSNVTLWNYRNWVMKNSTDIVNISGTKSANNNIALTNATYAALRAPKLTIPLCVTELITPEIRTSIVTIDNLSVENLNVSDVFGAYNLSNIIFDSVSALQSVDFSTKLFTGKVYVKNLTVLQVAGTEIKIQDNHWLGHNRIKGPINITKLTVELLEVPARFNFPLPKEIKKIIVKENVNIEQINNMNISSFMKDVFRVDSIISLDYVTFDQDFTSDHIHATRSTFNFSQLDANPNLHSKRISKTLEANNINVPQTFGYRESDTPTKFVIQGSAKFAIEPTVQNVKDASVKKLCQDLWMLNEDSIISGSHINFKNITLESDVILHNPLNSLNLETWSNLSNILLSKTKQQYITVISSFKDVEVSNIIVGNNSSFHCSDGDLENMLTKSLMKNGAQVVEAVWFFLKLNIGIFNWNGKLNGIDLNTEFVRHDAKENIITGRKIIQEIETIRLWYYDQNFSKWTKNVLLKQCKSAIIIKGRKTFTNINLSTLRIKGKIMGHKIQDALLKTGNQTVSGMKKIQGHLNAPRLITDSTVNDIIITPLINDQLKKHKAVQTIKSKMDFRNNFEILGNIIINGLYHGTDLTNVSKPNKLDAVLNRTARIMGLAEDIKTALQKRAIYINKFEMVEDNITEFISDSDGEHVIVVNNTCLCEPKNISFLCNETKLLSIVAGTDPDTFKIMKLILLDNIVFVVVVASDFVSIYSYATVEQKLEQKAELYVPNILQAFVEPADNSLWIILRLSEQTLVLRYQVWHELEQYILPGSDTFTTSMTPNNQLLLMRSDGMWNLGGAFHPQHIFKMPLNKNIKTFVSNSNYYVKLTKRNNTSILKARYVGN